MRKGQNPAKLGLAAYQLPPLAVAMPVYIPSFEGYFAGALEILKIQLASIHAYTPAPFDVVVLDNGSCAAAQQELQRLQAEGWIDVLVLSAHNLGKVGAINWLAGALQHELIAYTDSDVLFRPGWFEASRVILDTFPRAGIVAAQPIFNDVLEGGGEAQQAVLNNTDFEWHEETADPAIAEEFARGLGASPELREVIFQRIWRIVQHRASGTAAILGASHMQFLTYSRVLKQVLPLPAGQGLSAKEDRAFDARIDELGFLHLSTLEPYVYHLGNTLEDWIAPEIAQLPERPVTAKAGSGSEVRHHWLRRALAPLAKSPAVRGRLKTVYQVLFDLLAE